MRWPLIPATALVAVLLLSACGGTATAIPSVPVDQGASEDAWGILVTRVSLTGAGGWIDVRYRVIDVEKALASLGPSAQGGHEDQFSFDHVAASPLLIDEDSGYALTEGSLHQSGRVRLQRLNPKLGIERYILFSNTGGLVHQGAEVSLMLGGLRLTPLVVQ